MINLSFFMGLSAESGLNRVRLSEYFDARRSIRKIIA